MSVVDHKETQEKEVKKRYVYKNQSLFKLIEKIKLWPSRSGILHGIKTIERTGNRMTIKTHCGEEFTVWDSKNSRSARWLRNRLFTHACPKCQIPEWKTDKYSTTVFSNATRR